MTAIDAKSAIIALLLLLPVLSGCAAVGASYGAESAYNAAFRTKIEEAAKLSEAERVRLSEVKFIEQATNLGIPKGEVVGLACKLTVAVFVFKWTWRPELGDANGKTPEEASRTQLRLKAMNLGANAVASPTCIHKDGLDWGNNCFESWVCMGQAMLLP
jgi:hypothetical protein